MSLMQNIPDPLHGAHPDATRTPTHDARDLIPNGATAQIVLNGQTYTLRITRAGKLILTK